MNQNNIFLPPFPDDYVPQVITILDDIGLLIQIEKMKVTREGRRGKDYNPRTVGWYFDGQDEENIAFAYSRNEVYINRIQNLNCINEITENL